MTDLTGNDESYSINQLVQASKPTSTRSTAESQESMSSLVKGRLQRSLENLNKALATFTNVYNESKDGDEIPENIGNVMLDVLNKATMSGFISNISLILETRLEETIALRNEKGEQSSSFRDIYHFIARLYPAVKVIAGVALQVLPVSRLCSLE